MKIEAINIDVGHISTQLWKYDNLENKEKYYGFLFSFKNIFLNDIAPRFFISEWYRWK